MFNVLQFYDETKLVLRSIPIYFITIGDLQVKLHWHRVFRGNSDTYHSMIVRISKQSENFGTVYIEENVTEALSNDRFLDKNIAESKCVHYIWCSCFMDHSWSMVFIGYVGGRIIIKAVILEAITDERKQSI